MASGWGSTYLKQAEGGEADGTVFAAPTLSHILTRHASSARWPTPG